MRLAGDLNSVPPAQLGKDRATYLLRVSGLVALVCLPAPFLLHAFRGMFDFVLADQTYTHVPLIPVVSAYLIYANRSAIFQQLDQAVGWGALAAATGVLSLVLMRIDAFRLSGTNQNSLLMFGFLLLFWGAWLLCFGIASFRKALFPLLFLLFMIPIPEPFMTQIVNFLREGSATCAEWMFRAMGVPFLRDGFDFALPRVTIRVAEECSGIRSTLALIILVVLVSQFFLKRPLNRVILCFCLIPISIIKNGIRIAVLSAGAIYIDPSFLTGPLHRQGGIIFYLIALAPMFFALRYLQRRERRSMASPAIPPAPLEGPQAPFADHLST
jgi:exosortase